MVGSSGNGVVGSLWVVVGMVWWTVVGMVWWVVVVCTCGTDVVGNSDVVVDLVAVVGMDMGMLADMVGGGMNSDVHTPLVFVLVMML